MLSGLCFRAGCNYSTDVPSGCACMLHNYWVPVTIKKVMSLWLLSLQRARLLLLAVCFFSVRQNTSVAYVSVSVKHTFILIITTYVTYHYYPSSSPPSTKRSCPSLAKTAQISFVHSSTLPKRNNWQQHKRIESCSSNLLMATVLMKRGHQHHSFIHSFYY
jgi:hypothetical protein